MDPVLERSGSNEKTKAQNAAKGVYSFDEAITLAGFGKFNWIVLLASGLVIWGCTTELICSAILIPATRCDLDLEGKGEESLLTSVAFLGIIVCSPFAGMLADIFGRRNVMLIAMGLSFCLTCCACLTTNKTAFFVLRFFTGVLLSCPYVMYIAYVGEFNDAKHREKMVAWVNLFSGLGNAYIPIMAWILLRLNLHELYFRSLEIRPWRFYLFSMALPEFFATIILFFLPESPRFLHSVGKSEQARVVLSTMFHFNTNQDVTEFPVQFMHAFDSIQPSSPNKGYFLNLLDIVKKKLKMSLLLGVLCFLTSACGLGLFMWIPDFINDILLDHVSGKRHTVCQSLTREYDVTPILTQETRSATDLCNDKIDTRMFTMTLIMTLFMIILFGVMGFIINRVGKKYLLLTFYGLSTLSAFTIPYARSPPIIAILLITIFFCVPCTSLLLMYALEAYSTHHRGTMLTLLNLLSQMGVVAGITVLGELNMVSCILMFVTVAVLDLAMACLVLIFPAAKSVNLAD